MTNDHQPQDMTPTQGRKALAARRKRFRRALQLADVTMTAWCRRHGYSRTTVYEVLNGRRVSAPLDRLLARFIDAQAALR